MTRTFRLVFAFLAVSLAPKDLWSQDDYQNLITIIPKTDASAVGGIKLQTKDGLHSLRVEGPDTLTGDKLYKFNGALPASGVTSSLCITDTGLIGITGCGGTGVSNGFFVTGSSTVSPPSTAMGIQMYYDSTAHVGHFQAYDAANTLADIIQGRTRFSSGFGNGPLISVGTNIEWDTDTGGVYGAAQNARNCTTMVSPPTPCVDDRTKIDWFGGEFNFLRVKACGNSTANCDWFDWTRYGATNALPPHQLDLNDSSFNTLLHYTGTSYPAGTFDFAGMIRLGMNRTGVSSTLGDVGLTRVSAGALEINNGTTVAGGGSHGDLYYATSYAGTGVQSPLFRINNGSDYFDILNTSLGTHSFDIRDSNSTAILTYRNTGTGATSADGSFGFNGKVFVGATSTDGTTHKLQVTGDQSSHGKIYLIGNNVTPFSSAIWLDTNAAQGQVAGSAPGGDSVIIDNQGFEGNFFRVKSHLDYWDFTAWGSGTSPLPAGHLHLNDSSFNTVLDVDQTSTHAYPNALFAFTGNLNATALIQSTATGTNPGLQVNGGTFQVLGNGLVGAANYNVGSTGTIAWNGQSALRYTGGHLQSSDDGVTWVNLSGNSVANGFFVTGQTTVSPPNTTAGIQTYYDPVAHKGYLKAYDTANSITDIETGRLRFSQGFGKGPIVSIGTNIEMDTDNGGAYGAAQNSRNCTTMVSPPTPCVDDRTRMDWFGFEGDFFRIKACGSNLANCDWFDWTRYGASNALPPHQLDLNDSSFNSILHYTGTFYPAGTFDFAGMLRLGMNRTGTFSTLGDVGLARPSSHVLEVNQGVLISSGGSYSDVYAGNLKAFSSLVFPSGATSPQIDATGLAGALNINGANTANGNIVLNPGAVSGNASVFVNASRVDQPGLVVRAPAGTTTAPLFTLRDSSNVAKFFIMGPTDASCPNCVNSVATFNSTATGTNLAFQGNGGTFAVNGAGAVSAAGPFDSTNGYKVGGISAIDVSRNGSFVNLTVGGTANTAINVNAGGITTTTGYWAGSIKIVDSTGNWVGPAISGSSQWTTSSSNIYNANSGNVFVGATTDDSSGAKFQVTGNQSNHGATQNTLSVANVWNGVAFVESPPVTALQVNKLNVSTGVFTSDLWSVDSAGFQTMAGLLSFGNSIGDKIYLYNGSAASRWGFGIESWKMTMFMDGGNPGVGKFAWVVSGNSYNNDAGRGPVTALDSSVMDLYTTGLLDVKGSGATAIKASVGGITSTTGYWANSTQVIDSTGHWVGAAITSSGPWNITGSNIYAPFGDCVSIQGSGCSGTGLSVNSGTSYFGGNVTINSGGFTISSGVLALPNSPSVLTIGGSTVINGVSWQGGVATGLVVAGGLFGLISGGVITDLGVTRTVTISGTTFTIKGGIVTGVSP